MSDPASAPAPEPMPEPCEQCERTLASPRHSCPNAVMVFNHDDPNYCNCCTHCTTRCRNESIAQLQKLGKPVPP